MHLRIQEVGPDILVPDIGEVDERVHRQTQPQISSLPRDSSNIVSRDANVPQKLTRGIVELDDVVPGWVVLGRGGGVPARGRGLLRTWKYVTVVKHIHDVNLPTTARMFPLVLHLQKVMVVSSVSSSSLLFSSSPRLSWILPLSRAMHREAGMSLLEDRLLFTPALLLLYQ